MNASVGLLLLAVQGIYAQECTLYVSTSGNDRSSVASARSPVATPHRALQMAAAGSVICLRGGTYTFTTPLNISKAVTLMSFPGERAVLTGSTEDTGALNSMVVVGASDTVIQDLEIRGGSYYGIKVTPDLLGAPPANVRLRRLKIHDTGRDSVKTQSADNLLIEDSEIYRSGVRDASNAEGIDTIGSIPAGGSQYGITVRKNFIHDTATNGLYLKGGTVAGLVEQNRLERIGWSAIMLGQDTDIEAMRNGATWECTNCVARNNIVIGAGAAGIACMAAQNPVFEFNTLVDVAKTLQDAFRAVKNTRSTPCNNVTVKNNVFVVNSKRPMITLQGVTGGISSDYNAWQNTTGTYIFANNDSYMNLARWRTALNQDWNSISAMDLMLDPSALYRPLPGSPLINRSGAGVTPGAHQLVP
jgi:hypothetical protein